MPPAARITDMHVCPMVTGVVPHVGGPILPPAMVTVLTGGLPQARMSDMCVCVGPPDVIMKGSPTVLVGGLPAARMGDITAHGGSIILGLPTVMIGEAGGGGSGGGGGGMLGVGAPAPGKTGSVTSGDLFTALTDTTQNQTEAMTTSGAFSEPEAQAETLKAAANTGAPLVETCKNAKP